VGSWEIQPLKRPLRRREKRAQLSTCRREALYLVNVGVEACKVVTAWGGGYNADDDSTTKIGNLNSGRIAAPPTKTHLDV